MQNPRKFTRIAEGCRRLGIDKSTAYRNAGKNGFPNIYEVTPNTSAFDDDELDAYAATRPLAKKPQRTKKLLEGRAKAAAERKRKLGRKAGGGAA